MIAHVANLTRWEWYKLRRRWMPWILLAVIVAFSQLPLWGSFFDYRSQVLSSGEMRVRVEGPDGHAVFVHVSCEDLIAGRVPPLPPGSDMSAIERAREGCENSALRQAVTCPDLLAGRLEGVPEGADPDIVARARQDCEIFAILESAECSELLAGREPELPDGTDPRILDGKRSSCQVDAVMEAVDCGAMLEGAALELPPGTDQSVYRQVWFRCMDVEGTNVDPLVLSLASFTLPDSLTWPFAVSQVFGLLLLAILTASTLGTDYSWGTLRTVLIKGTGRWQYLAAKLVLIGLLAAGALAVVAAVTVLSSLLATALAPEPHPGAAQWLAENSAGWSNTLVVIGRTFVSLLPYLALAGFVTLLTASLSAGIAASLGYYFAETIAMAILLNLTDLKWFHTAADYVLVRSMTAWMMGSRQAVVDGEAMGGPSVR